MKIGVNCFLLAPDIGGIRQYFFNLFDALLAGDNANEYIFFYFPHNIEELSRLKSDRWRTSAILLDKPRDIYRHLKKIDLYFCPFSTLSPRPVPMPAVYTIPDIQEVYCPHFFTNYLIVARRYHYSGSSVMADRVITHSLFTKDSLVRFHGIPPDKVVVAHHCVDERFYRAGEIMRAPGIQLPENFIFYPANQWLHKNHDLLLRALSWLNKNKNTRVNLVLTGFGKEDGYPLQGKLKEYGIAQQVYHLGYVAVEELAYIYVHAQFLVFPSLFEGFGIPLVEAMASGCPILASRATSLPEIGGEAACYFNPASAEELGMAILHLLNDAELRADLAARGRKRAKLFSADKLASRHLEAFSQAAASFSMRKYYWYRFVYKYYHAGKILMIPQFYGMLRDIFTRKRRKLCSILTGEKK